MGQLLEVAEVVMVGDGDWLTVTEVAAILGVSPGKARQYADEGRLNEPVKMWRIEPRGDRRIHKTSAERLRQELQGN